MHPLTGNATSALLRAIGVTFVNFAPVVEEIQSRAWASVTFTGARHEFVLRLDGASAGAAADDILAGLEAAEFRLRGHILADIALLEREDHDEGPVRLRLEALTVEDF